MSDKLDNALSGVLNFIEMIQEYQYTHSLSLSTFGVLDHCPDLYIHSFISFRVHSALTTSTRNTQARQAF